MPSPNRKKPNEPDPQPEEDRTADFQCSRCGTIINEKVYEYSINKFGEPLCINAREEADADESITYS